MRLIVHRLSTVLHADTIFAVKNGRIVESGSRRQLLAAGGAYRALYAQQNQQREERKGTLRVSRRDIVGN